MKTSYTIAAAIVVIVIIIGGVFAYTASQTPAASPSPSPSATETPTQTPTATSTPTSTLTETSPTASPTGTPVETGTPTPTNTPATTSTPTAAPIVTATPTVTPTPTPTPVPTATPGPASLTGAGATFPQPFINATIVAYQQIRPNLNNNYQGGGSGAGVSGLTAKTVDYACSDAALTSAQTGALTNQVVTIPETIGAITLAYNLPGIATGLHLNGAVLANIFLGTTTNWNDPAITALNPTLTLPNHAINTIHRSESSGTTKWFTQYLSLVSPQWNSSVGYANSVQWPSGIGQSGNPGVAQAVNTTQYAIGYVELAYALQNGLTVAAMQNPSGNYITPSLASTTAAAQALPTSGLPSSTGDWTGVNILNTSGAQAYPICNPTYMLIYKDLNVVPNMNMNKATQLLQWVWYVVHDGQSLSASLQYASLPSNIVQYDEATIQSITFNGQAIPVS